MMNFSTATRAVPSLFRASAQRPLGKANVGVAGPLGGAFRTMSSAPAATNPLLRLKPSDPEYQQLLADAEAKLTAAGFDPASFRAQPIVWGDQDSFQHVNNTRYVRFFESTRMQWMTTICEAWKGPERRWEMSVPRGISLILGQIDVHFRRPVTYPDTVLFGYCADPPKPGQESSPKFHAVATGYSLAQQDFVVHSKETLVWYNYDLLKKCSPPKEASDALYRRARHIDLRTLHHKH